MYIRIYDHTTIHEIQETFSNFYPFLHLEFYTKPHRKYELSKPSDRISADRSIGDIRKAHVFAVIEMHPSTRVGELESEFQQRLGLSVQVEKKEKDTWEQTSGMDDFTLKELNTFGRSSSDEFIMDDYEEGSENY